MFPCIMEMINLYRISIALPYSRGYYNGSAYSYIDLVPLFPTHIILYRRLWTVTARFRARAQPSPVRCGVALFASFSCWSSPWLSSMPGRQRTRKKKCHPCRQDRSCRAWTMHGPPGPEPLRMVQQRSIDHCSLPKRPVLVVALGPRRNPGTRASSVMPPLSWPS
jgi:hypothetical protein